MYKNSFNHSQYWFEHIMEDHEDIEGGATIMVNSNALNFMQKILFWDKKSIHKYLKVFLF